MINIPMKWSHPATSMCTAWWCKDCRDKVWKHEDPKPEISDEEVGQDVFGIHTKVASEQRNWDLHNVWVKECVERNGCWALHYPFRT